MSAISLQIECLKGFSSVAVTTESETLGAYVKQQKEFIHPEGGHVLRFQGSLLFFLIQVENELGISTHFFLIGANIVTLCSICPIEFNARSWAKNEIKNVETPNRSWMYIFMFLSLLKSTASGIKTRLSPARLTGQYFPE